MATPARRITKEPTTSAIGDGGARTVDEWEARLGAQLRERRLQLNITQAELARRANVDRTTVARIEHGAGGSISSLVQITRALDRGDWLEAFMPPAPQVSPMALLHEQQRAAAGRRQRARPAASPS